MLFNKMFANKIAFAALFIALLTSALACQKKETQGHAPEFQFQWVGFSTQEKTGKLYVKRMGAAEENPKLQVRMPQESTEKLTSRHTLVNCDTHEVFNKVEPITNVQFEINFSKETMPLIKSLPRVATCTTSLRVYNEEGSSHTEHLTFTLVQDSEAPYEISNDVSVYPSTAISGFHVRDFKIKNVSELKEKFFIRDGLNYQVKKIFKFDPSQNGSRVTYRYSDDWVTATDYKVFVNDFEMTFDENGYFVFEVQSQQEAHVVVFATLPGGNCPADTLVGGRTSIGTTFAASLPRHYKGGLVHVFETKPYFMQFETSSAPLSDIVTSRRALLDFTSDPTGGVPIKALAEPFRAIDDNPMALPITYVPNLDDCAGILPDRLR